MSSRRSIFPSDEPSFANYARTLFSLPLETLERLLTGLESRKTSFSTEYVASILQQNVGSAQYLRSTILFILHRVDAEKVNLKDLVKEFLELGCKKEKADALAPIVLKTSKDAFQAAATLVQIQSYGGRTDHLHGFGAHINFTYLGRVGRPSTMFPLVRMTLVVQGQEETKEISFDLDAEKLQVLILEMQEILKGVRTESALLKKALGDNFTPLIGE